MVSPMGLRGVICERFGWTYDYLLNGIPWIDVHMMMIDAPRFIPAPTPPNTENKTSGVPQVPTPALPESENKTDDSLGGKLNKYLTRFTQ